MEFSLIRTSVILIVSCLCIFSTTEAAFGDSCNDTTPCSDVTKETCDSDTCVCNSQSGFINVDGQCKSSSISVTIASSSPSVMYGKDVTLTATISSEIPVKSIEWQRVSSGSTRSLDINEPKYNQTGGVESDTVTLTITGLTFEDKGSYQVQVINNANISKTSSPVSLDVTGEKPTIEVPGMITQSGTTVTIHCNVTVSQGSPAVTAIQWFFNDKNLNISNSNKYSGGSVATPSLTIHDIGSNDAGKYKCMATNPVGSTSIELVDLGPPTSASVEISVNPANHGSDVTFTGSYTSLLSITDIRWQRNNGSDVKDINITGSDKYTGSSVTGPSPKLVINLVQFIDEMSYRLMVSNGMGSTASNFIFLNVVGGALTVTTGANVTGRYGGSVTIGCTVTGPEVSNIKWKRHINNAQENISIVGDKYSGGSVEVKALTIHNLIDNDAGQYQCTASNPGGVYNSANRATVTVKYGQFDEDCSNSEPCDSSKFLTCINSKCLCMSTYYHKDQVCYPNTGIAPTTIFLNSTTNMIFVSWNNPTPHYELVTGYEVNWRFSGSSSNSSGPLEKNVNQYTVSGNLMSGQLYTVNVISKVTLSNPAGSFVQPSPDTKVRTVPSAPGPVIPSQSNFAHNNLQIKWTAPVNTVVTKYEVTLNGTTYTTMSSNAMFQFTGKVFVPGESYVISIVTVSGTTSDIVKRSSEHTEWIRTTPTKPHPPTNLQCPQSPLDVSLEISWTVPAEPNGLILKYQIEVSPENLQMYTSSNETHKNVEGLSSEQMYTFTVRTVNDANDSTSEPSQPITCKTKAGVSSAPTILNIDEIQSRGFRIEFNRPVNVSGILAAYKIVISEGGNCVQQILVHGHCSMCMNTLGCPPPINFTVPDITNNDVSYTAGGLMPYTHYMVKVVAITGEGEGRPVNIRVTTDEEVPLQPGNITASIIGSSYLSLAWTLPDPSPGNTTYTIYIYEGTDDVGTDFLMKESTKVYGFETKMLSVTGLEEYWPYKFKVNAATAKGNRTSDFSSVFKTKQAEVMDDETTSKLSIIGSVVAVILVVAVIVIGILIWKRNRRHKEYKEQANTYADLNLDERTKVDQPYSLLEHGSRTVKSKSVPLNSFYDYVVDLLKNSRQKLTKEYYDLLLDTERSASTVASSKNNVSKNRGNIIPYDFNRVKLCSHEASDYIDASVMLEKVYILTSYPIEKTFGNFWQMVWEQNVSTIVVITGQSDARESWYFSDNEGTVRTIERIDVELLAKFKSSESLTMRKIKLSRGKHSKVVNHFHVIRLEMTDLPNQILALINTITQNNIKNTGPQVVHGGCTGVDNSGVYIAVDHVVKSIVSGGNEIDVYGTARTVMKERMFSISSLEQYSAIYTYLQKYLQNSPACKNDATGAYEYLP